MNDCGLNSAQLERFDEQGFLLLPGMLDPVQDLDPILAEYAGVLDRLAHTLYTQGKVSSPYPELPFGERVSRMYEESGEMLNHWFDFHLPQRHVTHDTPLWVGPAGFRTLVWNRNWKVMSSTALPSLSIITSYSTLSSNR